jgi:hypothetical protein
MRLWRLRALLHLKRCTAGWTLTIQLQMAGKLRAGDRVDCLGWCQTWSWSELRLSALEKVQCWDSHDMPSRSALLNSALEPKTAAAGLAGCIDRTPITDDEWSWKYAGHFVRSIYTILMCHVFFCCRHSLLTSRTEVGI